MSADMAGYGQGQGSVGEGPTQALQNVVAIVGEVDEQQIISNSNNNTGNTMYKSNAGQGHRNLNRGEFAFTLRNRGVATKITPYPLFLTGLGGLEVTGPVDDGNVVQKNAKRKRAARADLALIGILVQSHAVLDSRRNSNPDKSIQIYGTAPVKTLESVTIGALMEAVPPTDEELDRPNLVGVPGVVSGKPVLVAKQFSVMEFFPDMGPDYDAAISVIAARSGKLHDEGETKLLVPLWDAGSSMRRGEEGIGNAICKIVLEKLEHASKLRTRIALHGELLNPVTYIQQFEIALSGFVLMASLNGIANLSAVIAVYSLIAAMIYRNAGIAGNVRTLEAAVMTPFGGVFPDTDKAVWDMLKTVPFAAGFRRLKRMAARAPDVRTEMEMSLRETDLKAVYNDPAMRNVIGQLYSAIIANYETQGSNVFGTVARPGKPGDAIQVIMH